MFTIYQLRGRISSIHSMGISGIILLESPNDQRLKGSSTPKVENRVSTSILCFHKKVLPASGADPRLIILS